ncbi:SMC-Scp complex subunit ScpB [Micromonospora orduensis]|uniref:SMC-Scp complex subunit ScpB n=1 Tax=Micromonospora orduensis TaxID=1420891 RepID=UPI00363CD931
MSDEERRDSLADQAAAWVPPWERPRRPDPTTPAPSAAPQAEAATEVTSADEEAAEAAEVTAEADEAAGEAIAAADEERDSDRPWPTAVTVPPLATEDQESAPPFQGPESPRIAGETDGPGTTDGTGEAGAAGEAEAAGVPPRAVAGRRRVTAAPEPAPELSDGELRGALEAILLVVDEPVSELVLAQVLEQPAERIGPMLDEIAAGYTAAGHGFELRRAAGGWRLYTRPEYATYVERFVLDGQSVRLTQAALETLAVVAYKQPVTRSRISAIRGVNCDGVIRTLVTRGLVEECGTETDSGAFLYRTTTLFLEKLGLNTVDELPPLAPFLPDDVEELADATR